MKRMFVLVALFVGLGAFVWKSGTLNEALHPDKGLKVGDIAPDFKLKNANASTFGKLTFEEDALVGLEDFQGAKGWIVTFTCNTCPFAVMYEDRLIQLHNKYANLGYPVVAINPNDPEIKPGDSYEAMKQRAKEKGFPFVYLFDEKQEVYPAYGATRTPHVFLLDNERRVRYIGAIDNNAQDAEAVSRRYVEEAIAALERGEDPDPPLTKAIGCTIKAK
ncbi:MAG: thioredoxin family protein [Bacteroidetes bacterium]|nr:MAG: thioredoxin family protein [Bacteroidota bacterium]